MNNRTDHNAINNREYEAEDLASAVETLKKGGLILYPTDTVWGIGCDATNEEAVKRVYELKKRADAKSMLVLVGSETELDRTVEYVPEYARMLIETADSPLTIIYDRPKGIAQNLLAEDGSLGIRVTNETFSRALCRKFRKPIVSTSANISGKKTAAIFSEIAPEIIESVDYVVKFRRNDTQKKKSSHIIKVSDNGTFKIIR